MEAAATKTTCPYCGVGCGVITSVAGDGSVAIRGDTEHPANYGRLCSKGSALGETVDLDDRLLYPSIHGHRASWDEALDLVAGAFSSTIAEHGPDSVAFYISGQLLTEDYYVANKLMKGFIGAANIDTNSRLCMASSVAGHRRAFGADTVPGTYEDLELADLIVLVGSNLAWCHPVLYQRIAAAMQKRPQMKIVLVDPRRTMTADIAEMHLAVRPDGDVALFNGLLAWLADHDALDRAYIAGHTSGFDDAFAAASAMSFDEIAEQTGVAADELRAFYALFARTEKVVTVYSQGVNQSSAGTDKVNAIINCHFATGRIGRAGMGPFSVTGQPNAMGGREVGGLANMLAAHMEIENAEHRDCLQRFWRAPTMAERPGLKAVEMFRAVADGRIKAIWIMGTNPVVSMPDADFVEAALKACPLVVVSDVVAETDTLPCAHIKLPAAAWGEKDGTVTNSERRISRQRRFLPLPGVARPDWDIICDVAQRMGFADAFSFKSAAEIFAEYAALSAFENDGARDFDIGAFADIDAVQFDNMVPFQWPRPTKSAPSETRFFADGNFYTADRKGRFIAVTPCVETRTNSKFPFVLNTGRVRDHWHTMTRTAKSQRLSQHLAEPFAEIHPHDAARLGIHDADVVRISSANHFVLVRALLSKRQVRGAVFVPMHWNDQFASRARVDSLVPSTTDPQSGQPAFKHVAVDVARFEADTYGFAVLADRPRDLDADYWALAKCRGGWRLELALAGGARDWTDFANSLFGCGRDADLLFYQDVTGGQHRFACFEGERLVGALFLAAEPVSVSRDWAVEQLSVSLADPRRRFSIIAARPGAGGFDRGATVCSCFGVGANQITAAIAAGRSSVEAVGQSTQAGTNCGSCRAEIRKIIDANQQLN
ncbi:MAG TPA: molybdopterin-dependent oxidoreductase, partial [Methylovirgula sp.]